MGSAGMTRRPVVIVGAGPAGLAAAIVTAEAGLQPTVIDENPLPGGQIYRQPPTCQSPSASEGTLAPRWRSGSDKWMPARGTALLQRFQNLKDRLTLLTRTAVWGLFPPRQLALVGA